MGLAVGGIVAVTCFALLSWDMIQFIRESTVSEPGAGFGLLFFGMVSSIVGGVVAAVTIKALSIRIRTREKAAGLGASSEIKPVDEGTETT